MARETTGRRWTRAPRECPSWCAGDHTCTAKNGYPSGEHRSKPVPLRAEYGVLICTRVQALGGRGRMEVRLAVDLDPDEGTAHRQAQHLAVGIDLTVRAVLSGLVPDEWAEPGEWLDGVARPRRPAEPRALPAPRPRPRPRPDVRRGLD